MDKQQIAELETAATAAAKAAEDAGGTDETLNTEAESAQKALEKAKSSLTNKPERTEAEKAAFNLKKNAERARELGLDPADVLGVKPQLTLNEDLSDDTPLTVGKLKEFQRQEGKKTALQLVEDLEDEAERNEVRTLLETRITPSGNPHADLSLARAAANSLKNARIAEEAERKTVIKRTAAGGSANGKKEDDFTPTSDEVAFMKPPFNLTKEKIIEARTAKQE